MMAEEFEIARQATLEEVKQTGIETKTTIGDIGDPAGEESLVGLIKNIPETVPTGAVKSVQRGILAGKTGSNPMGFDNVISINSVNPAKCIVIINTMFSAYNDSTFGMAAYLYNLTSTVLTVKAFSSVYFSWQVIEFF